MTKKHVFIPVMRIIAVVYFIYKMAFSDPNLNWSNLLVFDHSSSGAFAADIFVKVLFGLIFIVFIVYQFRQTAIDLRQDTPQKDRLRLISIIWSLLFFPTATMSLFNVNLEIDNTSIADYLMEFYTISTLIGVIAGIIVLLKDINIQRQLRKDKKAAQDAQ